MPRGGRQDTAETAGQTPGGFIMAFVILWDKREYDRGRRFCTPQKRLPLLFDNITGVT